MSLAVQPSILPGFQDPVHDAQQCFRIVLEAMSRPGNPVSLEVMPPARFLNASIPASCLAGMVAIALTLCDADTSVWLDSSLDTPAMRRHLRFHCGCPMAEEPEKADFAFIGDPEKMPRFERFSPGEPEYPDRSATLVLAADIGASSLERGLCGPGISPLRHPLGLPLSVGGLPSWFWEDRAVNQAGYPLGVDVLFVSSRSTGDDSVLIAGLPRTTRAAPPSQPLSGSPKEKQPCMSR